MIRQRCDLLQRGTAPESNAMPSSARGWRLSRRHFLATLTATATAVNTASHAQPPHPASRRTPPHVRVVDARVTFSPQQLVTPLRLSTGVITDVTQATAEVLVEVAGAGRATGRGTVYLSDLWAWPSNQLSHAQRDSALQQLCTNIADQLPAQFGGEHTHPCELGMQLHDWVCHIGHPVQPPRLARMLCGSPFDAAIHDGTGLALKCSAFDLYRQPVKLPSVDRLFGRDGACRAIDEVITKPRFTLPAWYVVNRGDDLDVTLAAAIQKSGITHFKLKLSGDNDQDVRRTVDVYRGAKSLGVQQPRLCLDSNGGNPDANSVREFLRRLESTDPLAYQAVFYVEHPTDRDIRRHAFDWNEVAARKPVVLDEGLTSVDVLSVAQRQGWSGFALKTCKGHSFMLVVAAWAARAGMLITLQDLTNPGIALVHAALMAAHLPTLNGVELNSPQFTPAANLALAHRFPQLFEPSGGVHRLRPHLPAGLGSSWETE